MTSYRASIYTSSDIMNYKGGDYNNMTSRQRMENDIATIDKREIADSEMKDSRIRNDDLTRERRYKADRAMDQNRSRNDEITLDRRALKDKSGNMVLAVSLMLLVLTVGTIFILV